MAKDSLLVRRCEWNGIATSEFAHHSRSLRILVSDYGKGGHVNIVFQANSDFPSSAADGMTQA